MASLTIPPAVAAQRYAAAGDIPDSGSGAASADGFGAALSQALQGAIASGTRAEQLATQGIAGKASITDVVTAVSKAELALQTTSAIRDRVVQAYQDIMHMPI